MSEDMKQADFYLLDQTEKEKSYRWACQWVYSAWKEKRSVYIHCENEVEAKIVDDMLWTFKDTSFIPHQLISASDPTNAITIWIGHDAILVTPPATQVLLNLTQNQPDCFSHFAHIIEVVPQAVDERSHAREKYKIYKKAGYECVTHSDAP